MIDISTTIIETDRLILRAFLETDVDDLYEYASVDGVGEMAGWARHESLDDSKAVLQSFIEAKKDFAVVYKENNKVIGSLGLHRSWASDESEFAYLESIEIGYALSKAFWGRGFMPEAVKAVIKYCFTECAIEVITCGHFVTNDQSRRVIEKCGFLFVKQSEYYSKQLQKTFKDMKYIPHKQTT